MTTARVALLLCGIGCAIGFAHAAVDAPKAADDEFHFIVLGDSQFDDPPTFNRMIDDVRLLYPAFVIQVGDLIEGYTNDLETVATEWERFGRQIAPLAPIPFLPVPGNHDLYNAERRSDPALEALYRQTWGDTYYTFAYRNAGFFVLNSDSPGNERRIDAVQWQWLERELEKSRAEHLFVFMHRPPSSLENAAALHELLRRFPVRYVFYGHLHHYHFEERDGIRYVMVNAAADGALTHDETGSFDHFVQVSVRDHVTSFGVVRADAVEPPDLVHPSDNVDLFEIARGLAPPTVPLTADGEGFRMALPLGNPSAREITVYVSCTSEDERWRIDPARFPPLVLEPGMRQTLNLKLDFAPSRQPESAPVCELRVPFSTTRGSWIDHTQRVRGVHPVVAPEDVSARDTRSAGA